MKPKKSNRMMKSMLTLAFTTCIFYYGRLNAQDFNERSPGENKPSILVDFKGKEKDWLAFEINIAQPIGRRINLRILDQYNNELYSISVFEKEVNKRILVAVDDIDKLVFSIGSGKYEMKKTFLVNYRFTESIEVKEQERD